MSGTDHPPSTHGSPRPARRAILTGLAALGALALPVAAVAASGDGSDTRPTEAGASTNTSFLDGQLELVRARAAAEATTFEVQAAPAAPVVVDVPTTAAPTTAPPPPPTTTPPPPPPPPAPAPAASSGYGDPDDPATWDRLAQCEASGNWAANTGNGYYGGLQFSLSSWQAVGGSGYPHQHSRETQIEMGRRLYNQGGWSHWPTCSRKLGYR